MGSTIQVLWIGHAGILLRREDALVAVDPFLEGKFCWRGNNERYLGKSPWIGPNGNAKRFIDEFAGKIKAICITHAHGDHFDPASVLAILERNPSALLIAPRPVIEWMRHAGIAAKGTRLVTVTRKTDIEVVPGAEPIRVGALLDPNFPCIRFPPRVGYVVYPPGGRGVAHLGDSHGPGQGWHRYRRSVGGIVTWLRETPASLQAFFSAGRSLSRIWYIHWEPFAPGHFDCNLDPAKVVGIRLAPPVVTALLSYTEWTALPEVEGEN